MSVLNRFGVAALTCALLLGACGGGDDGVTQSPVQSPAPSATAAPSASPTATEAPTPERTPPETPTPAPPTPTPFSGVAQVVRRGNTGRSMVAFSFDAGSDVGYASQILDTLSGAGIHASFGMTGKWVEQHPDLVRRMANEGHELINHTYDHASFTGGSTGTPPLTQAARWDELDRTESVVQQIAGVSTKPYFRPPYGDYDDSVNADVGARGYAYNIMWTVDSRGWTGLPAGDITQRCLDLAEPGAIYVFHVGGASQDGPALQGIIDGLRAAGYEIGSVSDVLAP